MSSTMCSQKEGAEKQLLQEVRMIHAVGATVDMHNV